MEVAQKTSTTTATEVQPHNEHTATKESPQSSSSIVADIKKRRQKNRESKLVSRTPQRQIEKSKEPLEEELEETYCPKLVVSSEEEEEAEDDNEVVEGKEKLVKIKEDYLQELLKLVSIRKRYELKDYDSEDQLLGFNDSGEPLMLSESASTSSGNNSSNNNNNNNNSPNIMAERRKTTEITTTTTKDIEQKQQVQEQLQQNEEIEAPAAKRLKKCPEKYSPQREEPRKSQTIKAIKTEQQETTHIVGDADVSATKARGTANGKQAVATPPIKPLSAQDAFYKKPFEYGWKRELVWRATPESGRERADVYYISPAGKKIRTRHDILPLLQGDLTMEHFCWLRQEVGVGPEHETVRNAKPNPNRMSTYTIAQTITPPAPITGKRMPKPKGPKGASPPPEGWTPTRALKVNNAALNSKSGGFGTGFGGSMTPTSHRNQSSNSNTRSASSRKKYSNDIENDLKQINESIRNSLPTQPALAKLEAVQQQQNNATALSNAMQQNYARNVFANMSYTFDSLLIILKYLKIHERMRFASVCKMWHAAANSRFEWETVRMKNSKVCNWAGCATALQRNGTKHLDMRKMLFPSPRSDETWLNFMNNIGSACFLETIHLCRCPSRVVESLFNSNRNLRVLNAITINDDAINLENVKNLTNLTELRLRTNEPAVLTGNLTPLSGLTKLTHLSLTAIRTLNNKHVEALAQLTALRCLELGECGALDATFAHDVLPKLTQLERLRLENGQDTTCETLSILVSAGNLQKLVQLELVNFDVRPGFEERLKQCKTLSKLLIIPTYLSQSATTNQTVLEAVQGIANQLKVFTWGVTVELLRVTALYVDQCDESSKKEKHHFDECIPVLKPVPGAAAVDGHDGDLDNSGSTNTLSAVGETDGNDVPQIEILPLDKVERILAANMPNTKFQIVKVPYLATCKQQLIE